MRPQTQSFHSSSREPFMKYPTIVVHGFLATSLTNLPIHVALRLRGFKTFNVPLPGLNTQIIDDAARILSQKVEEVIRDTQAEKVNLVGVSKGGIIVLNYLHLLSQQESVSLEMIHKAVTVGSPLHGTFAVKMLKGLPGFGKRAQELAPESEFMNQLHGSSRPDSISSKVTCIYTDGDVLSNQKNATLPEAKQIRAPVGLWPVGHYQLVLDPRNLGVLAAELQIGQSDFRNV